MGKKGKPLRVARYPTEVRRGHPVAHADGRVRVHRAVLYDKIGPGWHSCHWCGLKVRWTRVRNNPRRLVADHLDGDTWNNAPDNLVPSCDTCNHTRPAREKTHCDNGHELAPDNVYSRPGTTNRLCRECQRVREAKRPPRPHRKR